MHVDLEDLPSSASDLLRARAREIAKTIIGGARLADSGASLAIFLQAPYVLGEVIERERGGFMPVRPAERGELVRVHFGLNDRAIKAALFNDFLKHEIPPFLEGIGNIVVRDTLEGVVVLRAD